VMAVVVEPLSHTHTFARRARCNTPISSPSHDPGANFPRLPDGQFSRSIDEPAVGWADSNHDRRMMRATDAASVRAPGPSWSGSAVSQVSPDDMVTGTSDSLQAPESSRRST
jgi:hypothetical protein